MGNPQFISIKKDITLLSFSSSPTVGIELYQQHSGTRYYRLKCVKYDPYSPSDFPTTYLYLGSFSSTPEWIYTQYFQVQRANPSFQTLFTRYPDTSVLRVKAYLQSSQSDDFQSYEESSEWNQLDIKLSGDVFAPECSGPTWVDTDFSSNQGVRTLTGSDQRGLQGFSHIRFTILPATPKYGTSVTKYTFSIEGCYSITFTASQIASSGRIEDLYLLQYKNLSGNVSVKLTVEDSRGMKRTVASSLYIVSYRQPRLTVNDTHRQGGTGSTVIIDFEGEWNGSTAISCTGITAKEEGSSAVFASLTPTLNTSGSGFSYYGVWSGVTFDSKKAYTITATFSDTVKTVSLTIPIPVGTPVLAIRDKMVGVNNPAPSSALDVSGIITQNGYPVLGFVKELGASGESVDLNNVKDTGIYVYKASSQEVHHFPDSNTNTPLLLMVLSAENYVVQKAWQLSGGDEFLRSSSVGWNSWRKVTVT
ncbi:MAG: hypothetical protein IJH07_05420 [Ruminococcus sp.]|nr:hypothetical protein [Ruminococcus sp.]